MIVVDIASHERVEDQRGLLSEEQVEPPVFEVADARREAEAEERAEPEHMIGDAARVGVVLLDPQARLMIEQPVEDMGGLAGGRRDYLGMVRAELVGDVGIEGHTRLVAMSGVDIAERFAVAAGLIILSVRR